jgi:hypothetical protein
MLRLIDLLICAGCRPSIGAHEIAGNARSRCKRSAELIDNPCKNDSVELYGATRIRSENDELLIAWSKAMPFPRCLINVGSG